MHDSEVMKNPDLTEICRIEEDLISALKTVVGCGIFSKDVEGKDLGGLVDMVKDMAETKRNCWEAKYYETVCRAMDEYEENDDGMGYNSNRYASGRYAPAGHGNKSGYGPAKHPNFRMYQDGWDEMMDGMGYTPDRRMDQMSKDSRLMHPYGYDHESDGRMMHDPYGNAYREYENARKHYTESKSMADKTHMDQKAMEHVNNSIVTLKEIWKSADPALRKDMKASLTSLVSEMPA